MKLSEAWANFDSHTGKASDITRQLAFGGIAVVWLFTKLTPTGIEMPRALVIVTILIVLGLLADLGQYIIHAHKWHGLILAGEAKMTPEQVEADTAIEVPADINGPGNRCFYAKVLLIAAAYVVLLVYLATRLSTQ